MAKQKKIKIDKYHVHECLDRAGLLCYIIDISLVQHPLIERTPKLLKKAEKVAEVLADLYQDIGNIDTSKLK